MASSDDFGVVVVGGGPVGLCLAMLLGSRGMDVCLVEANAEVDVDLRASTFHPPTLDMLEPYGITERMLADGLPCPHWQIRLHPSGDRAVFDLGVLSDETRHPYRLQCEQWRLSKALLAKLQTMPNVDLRFATQATEVTQADDGVTVRLSSDAGETTVTTRFVAGCDGSRSIVRHAAGLSFEGVTYPETTLLATTLFPFEQHLEGLSNVTYCWKAHGNFSLLKVPGRWRVSIYPDEHLSIEEQMTPEALNASLQDIVPRDQPYEIRESRPYRVHMRISPSYRRGRLFLAGDAAHLNSPSGGMGLNGGLHDAFELAPILAKAVAGEAGEAELGLYDARRRPIAQNEILAQADRNRARMRERDPERRRALLADLQATTGDRDRLKSYLLRSSMIDGLRRAAAIF